MKITEEEKLMYSVMKAIYEGSIPISFKGSMVLKACLMEAGYIEETRHTVDIDANWNTDEVPTGEQMVEALQKAISRTGLDLKVAIYRMYGQGRSAGFELIDSNSGEILFTMDVDVNRPMTVTKIYELDGIRFCGSAPIQIIADKVVAISTDKVFRRIKDVVDLYYISHIIPFEKGAVLQTIKKSERRIEGFNAFVNSVDDLRHSYEKFRFAGGVNKPSFDDVYASVKAYIKDVLP